MKIYSIAVGVITVLLIGCSDTSETVSVSQPVSTTQPIVKPVNPIVDADVSTPKPIASPTFQVWDSFDFAAKPDISRYGLKSMRMVDRGWDYPNGIKELPEEQSFKKVMKTFEREDPDSPVFIDIEQWAWACNSGTPEKFETLVKWTREVTPKLKLGIYFIGPIRDFWAPQSAPTSPEYLAWQKLNNCYQKLIDQVDMLLPSVYAFYEAEHPTRGQEFIDLWVTYANAQVKEAKRLAKGKPVYPFLWMQYHDSNPRVGEQLIPGAFWKLQLETVKNSGADGLVIWGTGYTVGSEEKGNLQLPLLTWNENSEWWLETQKFLRNLR